MVINHWYLLCTLQDLDDGLKIIDFAHSAQLSSEQETIKLSRLQGTLEYLSPEVLNCENVGKPADIWSVGVIIYMLVTGGVSPFYGGSRLKTMKRWWKLSVKIFEFLTEYLTTQCCVKLTMTKHVCINLTFVGLWEQIMTWT